MRTMSKTSDGPVSVWLRESVNFARKAVSIRAMADMSGVSLNNLRDFANGKAGLSLKNVDRLATLFQVEALPPVLPLVRPPSDAESAAK